MSYCTYGEYVDFGGKGDAEMIEKALDEASLQINRACFGRVEGRGFALLTEFQRNLVKRAVATQADFIVTYGDFIDSPMSGFSAGSISMSFKDTAKSISGVLISNKAINYLESTGLISRRL